MKANKTDVGEYYNKPFPTRLRALLEKTNTSQTSLASIVGISRQAANYYINGITLPDIEKFQKIVEHFGVTADYMLGKTKNKTNENDAIGRELGLSDEAINLLREDEKKFNSTIIPRDYSSISDVIDLLLTQEHFPYFCNIFSDLKAHNQFDYMLSTCYPSPTEDKINEFQNNWIKLKESARNNGIMIDLLRGDEEILRHKYNEVFDLLKLILKDISGCTDDVLFNEVGKN